MSKELPYFKFFVSEWILGRISDHSDKVQGAFIKAICYYWNHNCEYSVVDFSKKLGKNRFNLLVKENFLMIENENVYIPFLDEQFEQFIGIHKVRVKGGLARAKQMQEQKTSYKDKIREDKIREDKIKEELVFPFFSDEFLKVWSVLVKEKKWKRKSHSALQASLNQLSKHSERDAIQMMKNSIAGEWQGLFELKKTNGSTVKTPITDTLRAYDEVIKKINNGEI